MRTVPRNVSARSATRRDRAYWGDILFSRTLPSLFFGLFLTYQLLLVSVGVTRVSRPGASIDQWFALLNQMLRLAFFTMLVVMYVIRLPAKSADRRPLVVLVSLVGTFALIASGFLPASPHGSGSVIVSDFLITFGLGWALWGLAYLRRSFSIIPEARKLVTGGPYSLSRNPLYFGEGIASVGVVLPVFGPWHALLLAIFVASQLLRIHWEQAILEEAFGADYRVYLGQVPMLVPFLPVKP